MSDFGDIARDLRRSSLLANPRRLCERLGLLEGAKRQSGDGVLIRCPVHGDRNPSCSVTVGPDGTTRCRCHACDWTGDALTLIGAATGIDGFVAIVDEACDIVGMPRPGETSAREWAAASRQLPQESFSTVKRTRPPPDDANTFWSDSGPVRDNAAASRLLTSRSVDPSAAQSRDLVRCIREGQALPWWAGRKVVEDDGAERLETWLESGHVLLVRTFDASGEPRSVRAWRVIPGDSPKRLPPAGHTAAGLVLANSSAVAMLRGTSGPSDVVIAEGESDWLLWSTRVECAVFGVGSGWWTPEHSAKIPFGSRVIIRTDRDKAGDRYADAIAKELHGRGQILRAVA